MQRAPPPRRRRPAGGSHGDHPRTERPAAREQTTGAYPSLGDAWPRQAKRQRKEDPIKFNVALTGVDATSGPVLIQGVHADTRGVTLLVVDGEVKANGTFLADIVAQGREDEATRVIFRS